MNSLVCTLLFGIGATVVMDVWMLVRRSVFRLPLPDYGLVGRWLAHMHHGQFHHLSITASPAVRGESIVGWTAHYLTSIAYAILLTGIWGRDWIDNPTLLPALTIGLATLAAPFLLMQPGMGAGFAASRTPRPWFNRAQSVITHLVFGAGLYLTALVLKILADHYASG